MIIGNMKHIKIILKNNINIKFVQCTYAIVLMREISTKLIINSIVFSTCKFIVPKNNILWAKYFTFNKNNVGNDVVFQLKLIHVLFSIAIV